MGKCLMSKEQQALPGQAILMLSVALDELRLVEGEPDIAKVRIAVLSVESTLQELLEIAKQAAGQPRLGL
jgi:hypothetical protein